MAGLEIQIGPVDITGPQVIVPISEDERLHIPVPIQARVTTDSYAVDITVVPNPATGSPAWSEMTITALRGVGSNDVLRALGQRGALEEIVQRASVTFRRRKGRWAADLLSDSSAPAARAVVAAFKAPKKARVPDDEVKQAAEVYRQAVDDGRKDPTMAVAEHFGNMPRSTAARRVQRAREAGLLGPARRTSPGEAG